MKKVSTILIVALALTALVAAAALGQAKAKPEFVGAEKCAKMCHKVQFESWLETKHAKAFTVLTAEEQKKPECVSCHITGKMADGTVLEGVQCESCHGAGSEYKKPSIMSKTKWAADPKAQMALAVEAGLVTPDEKVCVTCHKKEGNPHFKPLDYAAAKKLVHKTSAEAEKK